MKKSTKAVAAALAVGAAVAVSTLTREDKPCFTKTTRSSQRVVSTPIPPCVIEGKCQAPPPLKECPK